MEEDPEGNSAWGITRMRGVHCFVEISEPSYHFTIFSSRSRALDVGLIRLWRTFSRQHETTASCSTLVYPAVKSACASRDTFWFNKLLKAFTIPIITVSLLSIVSV